ncbi:MAG: pseudouridine-5'-phosphate glycosidase [Acidimicrobiales bacterium]|nr:pseudouridine-5'-phosphate glycosidase [Acidimicrobiaceae bacterium]|tara:strand:+ start:421 stop:1341 length:921 start_codon:yes stop_codon:yes gene_type:complete
MVSKDLLLFAPEVSDALNSGKPVVALESTIISHGMPYPRNVSTALEVEAVVRENGAIPATTALMDGQFCVGLSSDQIEKLGSSDGVKKVSLRDIGVALSKETLGATTVATTMFIAEKAGIQIFATGGLGGVHRGDSGDVSADLTALGTIPVTVVSAGVKAILDLPRTLEFLETLGVPVLGYETDVFPEFWIRGSNLPISARVDDPLAAAAAISAHWSSGMKSGVVLAAPVPSEDEADPEVINAAINEGLAAAAAQGVTGSGTTPFLLAHIVESTGGASLETNIALVKNNAAVAAKVAVELASLNKR